VVRTEADSMDSRMPEMNGIEAAKITQRYRKETRIIIAMGYDFVKQKAIEAELPFILKPFSSQQFAEAIEGTKPDQVVKSVIPSIESSQDQ